MRHTPGPWVIGRGGLHVYYVNPLIEEGDETINDPRHDSILVRACRDEFSGITEAEARANIRLIAAAPDLLESCQQALTLIRSVLPEFNWGASALSAASIQLLNEVPAQIQTAVKAAGETR